MLFFYDLITGIPTQKCFALRTMTPQIIEENHGKYIFYKKHVFKKVVREITQGPGKGVGSTEKTHTLLNFSL